MTKRLILEIGGGHNPHFRSDVVVDKFLEDNTERGGPLRIDRPTIIADGQSLPFKPKAFDYTIARHVMEHMDKLDTFFDELMGVCSAGFLSCPSTLSEYLFWWPFHKWFITLKDNTLHCCKKTDERPRFGNLFHYLFKNDPRFETFIRKLPPHVMNVQYHWKGKIQYVLSERPVLPDLSDWNIIEKFLKKDGQKLSLKIKGKAPEFLLRFVKHILINIKNARRSNFTDIDSLLACPICKGDLSHREDNYFCVRCSRCYPIKDSIPNFIVAEH